MHTNFTQVGELDIFRDEDLEYARTLGKAGIECEFHLVRLPSRGSCRVP